MRDPFSPDLVEQPRNERRLLEADIQEACVRYARERGYWAVVPELRDGMQFE